MYVCRQLGFLLQRCRRSGQSVFRGNRTRRFVFFCPGCWCSTHWRSSASSTTSTSLNVLLSRLLISGAPISNNVFSDWVDRLAMIVSFLEQEQAGHRSLQQRLGGCSQCESCQYLRNSDPVDNQLCWTRWGWMQRKRTPSSPSPASPTSSPCQNRLLLLIGYANI